MPFIVILGEEEKKNGGVKIKDVAGRQEVVVCSPYCLFQYSRSLLIIPGFCQDGRFGV